MKNIEPKKEQGVKSEQELAQEFVKRYEQLCDEFGFQIVVTPAWKISQDTGTWSTILQTSIGKISAKEK